MHLHSTFGGHLRAGPEWIYKHFWKNLDLHLICFVSFRFDSVNPIQKMIQTLFFLYFVVATATMTTKASGEDCSSCPVSALTLVKGDNVESITPTLTQPSNNTHGCAVVTVACDAKAVGGAKAITFMEFQNGLAGPFLSQNKIEADLECKKGTWMFTFNQISAPISQVRCLYSS